ncbi:TatD family hydrolase [Aneurinibacillus aneurinilyticus]|uniref:TatD family hydrolase n=1 Tax=Aneurinibacillus aneurinilyticus TaxID=1391 RepID=A0A848CY75_ANEAE|nr:TatD family hydrolase [Aneurinibacillus aneurinilyticus]MCI1695348.1 TatD family hydrolase [Aneurinibacillus aneurinilyticus]NMF00079.1 TatD family hydrolase [Aneurinibacillus aneurinilyticus]
MLFDTHAHLNDEKFNDDREETIARARENGVSYICNIGYNRETIETSLELTRTYDFIYTAIGWHPQDAKTLTDEDLAWIEKLASEEDKVVAIGEIGLDYYWDTSPKDIQQDVFRKQIRLARKLKLPIIIHDRDAHQDILDILREEKAEEVGGIMHCFSGSPEMARQCIDMNFYISLGGPVTFKNAKKPKEVAEMVPLERLLIETDCPYLTPEPYRGKRNESAYVRYVAEKIAELKNISFEQLAEITTANAKNLFHIKE